MSSTAGPLRTARLVTLSLAWCFAVVASSVGLNALIKSNQSKSKLKKLAPPPTVVVINTDDIFNVGVVATTASLLISILIFNFIAMMFLPLTRALSVRTLRLQSASLFFVCLLLFASMIPYMVFFVNRHADVRAFVGGVQLPAAIVAAVEKTSGSTSVYKKIDYLKLVAILPWFSLFFTLIAATVLFKAGSAAVRESVAVPATTSSMSTTEKETPSHHEKSSV
ncbi:hypothetical protein B0H34DRAFT_716409 [Crassisporium funariophilum]|nr:hypothetical protein B0H34DRAFT_716409 [Crassisporium funariophilum]